MHPEILIAPAHDLPAVFAARFEAEARQAIAIHGQLSLALPGGSVATTLFPRLAAVRLDWSRVHFFWGDERAVPPDHPESNFGVARRLWLSAIHAPAACIHRMPADAPDLSGAAAAYQAELARVLGSARGLDLALLGVGPDGHVGSLFPGHPLLEEAERWVAAIEDSPKPPPRRLTLTLPALAAVALLVVVATGEAKAIPMRAALRDPASVLPVALAIRGAGRVLVLLDPAAAALL